MSAAKRAESLGLALIALLAGLPGVLPGAEAYLDSSPHLLELQQLADVILVEDRWLSGWTEAANGGLGIALLNAPLAWGPLAAAVALGLPPAVAYLGANASALVAFVLALRHFLRPLGASAALLGALLAATWTPDLYGISGATAGMWPFRLALAWLFFGLARWRRRTPGPHIAIWLAVLLPLHTFAGVIGFAAAGWVGGLQLLRGGPWRRTALGIAGGVAASAWFWVPLADPAARSLRTPWAPTAAELLAMPLLPLDLYGMLTTGGLPLLGGPLALPVAAATLLGAALGLRRAARARRFPAWPLLGFALLLVVVSLAFQRLGITALGPNPWRHLVHGRVALFALAGFGLAPLLPATRAHRHAAALALGAALALCAAGVGLQHVPARWRAADAEAFADLRATLDALRAAPPGPLYIADTFGMPPAGRPLERVHPAGLAGLATGRPVWGSWYGIGDSATLPTSLTTPGSVAGRARASLDDPGDWLAERLRLYGIVALVLTDAQLTRSFSQRDDWRRVGGRGHFSAWVSATPPYAVVGVPPGEGRAEVLQDRRGLVVAQLHGAGAVPFRVRKAWHVGWRATLDGESVVLSAEQGTGLVEGIAPHAGRLELTWVHPLPRSILLLSCLAWLGLGALGWRRPRLPAAAGPRA